MGNQITNCCSDDFQTVDQILGRENGRLITRDTTQDIKNNKTILKNKNNINAPLSQRYNNQQDFSEVSHPKPEIQESSSVNGMYKVERRILTSVSPKPQEKMTSSITNTHTSQLDEALTEKKRLIKVQQSPNFIERNKHSNEPIRISSVTVFDLCDQSKPFKQDSSQKQHIEKEGKLLINDEDEINYNKESQNEQPSNIFKRKKHYRNRRQTIIIPKKSQPASFTCSFSTSTNSLTEFNAAPSQVHSSCLISPDSYLDKQAAPNSKNCLAKNQNVLVKATSMNEIHQDNDNSDVAVTPAMMLNSRIPVYQIDLTNN